MSAPDLEEPSSAGAVVRSRQRFLCWQVAVPLAVLSVLILVFETTDIDLWASDLAYDFEKKCWPHKGEWLYKTLLHFYAQKLVVVFTVLIFLFWCWSLIRPEWKAWRRAALYVVLSIAISSAAIGALKATTNRYCPDDFDRYGGKVPYTRLFEGTPAPFAGGRGFPAGHAGSAMALCALYLAARDRGERRAWLWLSPCVLLGALFAYVQHARGQHFLSHNLWSAAICWGVSVGVYLGFGRRLFEPRAPAASPGAGTGPQQ
jgi:membrane-associated PAP2 superfamily phosphatase